MKKINKYKTPQDKIIAWRKWTNSECGCKICELNLMDEAKIAAYLKEAIKNPRTYISQPMPLCNKALCFNAWLHSTTEEKKGK